MLVNMASVIYTCRDSVVSWTLFASYSFSMILAKDKEKFMETEKLGLKGIEDRDIVN